MIQNEIAKHEKNVSILILLEIVLEEIHCQQVLTQFRRFNPYSAGDSSGSITADPGNIFQNGFQSLFCWR